MTTTVLLRNSLAVAVASDRFQSLRNDDGTETIVPGTKIFQASEKVLGTITGRSGLAGIAHRLVAESIYKVGETRSPLQDAQLIADNVVAVNVACGVSNEELTQSAVCGVVEAVDVSMDHALLKELKALPASATPKKVTAALIDGLREGTSFLMAQDTDVTLGDASTDTIKAALAAMSAPTLAEHVGNDLGVKLEVTEELTSGLIAFLLLAWTKRYDTRDIGVVTLAGFGPDQVVPSTATLTIAAAPGGVLIYSINEDDPVVNGKMARVLTPAQDSAQQQLIHGITRGDALGFVGLAVEGAKEEFGPSDDALNKYGDKLESTLSDYFDETYTQPFLRVIRCLDAPGMARVADLLARVQELRAVASDSQATVGGLIEVATITKRDGIRWHRRSDAVLDGNGESVLG